MARQLRQVVHGGLAGVNKFLGKTLPALSTGEQMSDDEALTRYVLLHRGNARAIADFAATSAPRGTNPLQAAHDYETEMEKKLKERM